MFLPLRVRTAGEKGFEVSALAIFLLPPPFPPRGAQFPGYTASSSRAAGPGAPAVSPHEH